jgi:excisionase family DNA binding protein
MNATATIGPFPLFRARPQSCGSWNVPIAIPGNQLPFTLSQAAKASGRGKTTVFRAIKNGRLSAVRDETGGTWLIEESELLRVFPLGTGNSVPRNASEPTQNAELASRTAELEARVAELQGRLADSHETIADLRRRLDEERGERRAAQERITALLTDQRATPPAPPRRSWLPWRRRA